MWPEGFSGSTAIESVAGAPCRERRYPGKEFNSSSLVGSQMDDLLTNQTHNNKNKKLKNPKKNEEEEDGIEEIRVLRADEGNRSEHEARESTPLSGPIHLGIDDEVSCDYDHPSEAALNRGEQGRSMSPDVQMCNRVVDSEQSEMAVNAGARCTFTFGEIVPAGQPNAVTPSIRSERGGLLDDVHFDVSCTPAPSTSNGVMVINLGWDPDRNRSTLMECIRGQNTAPTKRRITSPAAMEEVNLISSEDDLSRPPAAKKVTEFKVGRVRADEVMNRMLARMIKVDEIREKSSMQGGCSGKIKRLLIELIEDLHLLSITLTEEQKKDFEINMKGAAGQEKAAEVLKNENAALRKRMVKIQIEKDALSKSNTALKSENSLLKSQLAESEKQLKTEKSKAKPKIVGDKLLKGPITIAPGKAKTSSPPGQLNAMDVEKIVLKVMAKVGVIPDTGEEDKAVESHTNAKSKEKPLRLCPQPSNPCGGLQLSSEAWPRVGEVPATERKIMKAKKKKKKVSMAAAEVQKRAEERANNSNRVLREVPAAAWEPPGTVWNTRRSIMRPRENETVVVTVNCVKNGPEEAGDENVKASYKQALTEMRSLANMKELGIPDTATRRGRNGGIVIEFPGVTDARQKALELVKRVQDKLPEGIKVACPQRRLDIVLHGLDPSVTAEEVVVGIAGACECLPEDISPSAIVESDSDMGRIWLSCPAAVARRAVAMRVIRLGWSTARISMARPRLVQCYRCFNFGHIRAECSSPFDRSMNCHKCGKSGHKINECSSMVARCALCPPGVNAHKTGSAGCAALQEALTKERKAKVKQQQQGRRQLAAMSGRGNRKKQERGRGKK